MVQEWIWFGVRITQHILCKTNTMLDENLDRLTGVKERNPASPILGLPVDAAKRVSMELRASLKTAKDFGPLV